MEITGSPFDTMEHLLTFGLYEAGSNFINKLLDDSACQGSLFVAEVVAGSLLYLPPNVVVWERR